MSLAGAQVLEVLSFHDVPKFSNALILQCWFQGTRVSSQEVHLALWNNMLQHP